MELIRIKYSGKIADTGRMHFYEYSRSQYALARFVTTVENFRITGKVAQRIDKNSYVNITVSAPEKGSFFEDLLIPILKDAAATAISLPLSAMISYAWHLMSPRRESTEEAITTIAEINLDLAKENTKQIEAIQDIVNGQNATTQQALDLVQFALETTTPRLGEQGLNTSKLEEIKKELTAEESRETQFREHIGSLENISESDMAKLTSRLRPMVSEIALPLRRSADEITFSTAAEGGSFAYVNDNIAKGIQNRSTEDEISDIVGRIRSYDRDSGVGKVSSKELDRVLNFIVPPGDRYELRNLILDAMTKDDVVLSVRRVIDDSGLPTSLILVDVSDL